jgi:hypothetical protein
MCRAEIGQYLCVGGGAFPGPSEKPDRVLGIVLLQAHRPEDMKRVRFLGNTAEHRPTMSIRFLEIACL